MSNTMTVRLEDFARFRKMLDEITENINASELCIAQARKISQELSNLVAEAIEP